MSVYLLECKKCDHVYSDDNKENKEVSVCPNCDSRVEYYMISFDFKDFSAVVGNKDFEQKIRVLKKESKLIR